MTDKLMTREEIAEIDPGPVADGKDTHLETDLHRLCATALAAHDIRDQALEEAAQIADSMPINDPTQSYQNERIATRIRSLKATSNG